MPLIPCENCNGTGDEAFDLPKDEYIYSKCVKCKGSGIQNYCGACEGTGRYIDSSEYNTYIGTCQSCHGHQHELGYLEVEYLFPDHSFDWMVSEGFFEPSSTPRKPSHYLLEEYSKDYENELRARKDPKFRELLRIKETVEYLSKRFSNLSDEKILRHLTESDFSERLVDFALSLSTERT